MNRQQVQQYEQLAAQGLVSIYYVEFFNNDDRGIWSIAHVGKPEIVDGGIVSFEGPKIHQFPDPFTKGNPLVDCLEVPAEFIKQPQWMHVMYDIIRLVEKYRKEHYDDPEL